MRLIVFFTSSTFVCLFQRDRKKNHKGKYTIMVVSTVSCFSYFNFRSMGFFMKSDGGVHDWKINILKNSFFETMSIVHKNYLLTSS